MPSQKADLALARIKDLKARFEATLKVLEQMAQRLKRLEERIERLASRVLDGAWDRSQRD